jgi:NAD(P)-dependent dehydrogenase (short-subunit alcohol dehydrogenase family)
MTVVLTTFLSALAAQAAKTDERWAVITGASSGIGSAIALEASARGYSVILAARRLDKLREIAAEATKAGAPAALVVQCDLGTAGGRNKLIAATRSRPLSLAVINAGFAFGGQFLQQLSKSVDDMVALNVGAMAALTRQYAEKMALQGGGRILLTGSIAGAPSGVCQLPLCPLFVVVAMPGARAFLAPPHRAYYFARLSSAWLLSLPRTTLPIWLDG